MTALLPAPESVIDLSMCRCRTKCENIWCKCRKNRLNCLEMCLCNDCENMGRDEDLDDVDIDSGDENDDIEDDD